MAGVKAYTMRAPSVAKPNEIRFGAMKSLSGFDIVKFMQHGVEWKAYQFTGFLLNGYRQMCGEA